MGGTRLCRPSSKADRLLGGGLPRLIDFLAVDDAHARTVLAFGIAGRRIRHGLSLVLVDAPVGPAGGRTAVGPLDVVAGGRADFDGNFLLRDRRTGDDGGGESERESGVNVFHDILWFAARNGFATRVCSHAMFVCQQTLAFSLSGL